MRKLLFTVEDCFKIAGRGTVAAADHPPDLPDLKVGDGIILIQPEGLEIKTEIARIENGGNGQRCKKNRSFNQRCQKRRCSGRNQSFLKKLKKKP